MRQPIKNCDRVKHMRARNNTENNKLLRLFALLRETAQTWHIMDYVIHTDAPDTRIREEYGKNVPLQNVTLARWRKPLKKNLQ